MSFDEFLQASGQGALLEMKRNATASKPLNLVFHNRLNELLRKFMLIGGMPEVVKTYIGNNTNFVAIQRVLSDITLSYIDDFVKYKKRSPLLRLREVMGAVIKQNGGKFIYSKAGNLSNPAQAKEALDLLEMAGIVHKVFHASGQGIPIAAGVNYKKFKAFLHDTGVFLQNTGMRLSEFLVAENVDMLNKGNLAELFVATELVKYADAHQRAQLYYWHREKRGSSAEIDFLTEHKDKIVPIEVKSGTSGKMQSMHLFLAEKEVSKGIRISLENFSKYGKIEVVPLYAISNLVE